MKILRTDRQQFKFSIITGLPVRIDTQCNLCCNSKITNREKPAKVYVFTRFYISANLIKQNNIRVLSLRTLAEHIRW